MFHKSYRCGQEVMVLYGLIKRPAKYVAWTGEYHYVEFTDEPGKTYYCRDGEIEAVKTEEK